VQPHTTKLASKFSAPTAVAAEWSHVLELIRAAPIWWVSTVRDGSRPHVTPLLSVLDGDALYFTTGPEEQKARNLAANPAVVLTTGANTYDVGTDIVVDGRAVRVTDDDRLRKLSDRWVEKYTEEWRFEAHDEAFWHGDGTRCAWVFEVRPDTIHVYERGDVGGATRFGF
jgi:nitroimidazol reductase NimA-like FMN-containing flavoprotein (pyridoxamine 5'-phosphate oxidase superfamily)